MDTDDSDTSTATGVAGSLPPFGIAALLAGSQVANTGSGMSPWLSGGCLDAPPAGLASLLSGLNATSLSKNPAPANKRQDPRLTDVTVDPSQPAYQTLKGTVIKLNKQAPATVLPYGDALDNLIAFADATGKKRVWLTGGAETSGHSTNSFHGLDKAIDVRDLGAPLNDAMDDETVRNAALAAGYTHGVREVGNAAYPHWHLQIGAGNGLGPEYDLSKGPIKTARTRTRTKTEPGQ